MFELPIAERVKFICIILLYLAAGVTSVLQLRRGGEKYQRLMTHFISLAVVLEAVLLIFRAVAVKGVPLTGLFESMIVLTLVLGLTYLVFGIFIRQVWFGVVMSWVIFGMIILTAMTARPEGQVNELARRPWAWAHGLAMALAEATILFAAATGFIYLVGRRRLKHKDIGKVIGVVPNIEKLEKMNHGALVIGFILLSVGLVSGVGMAALGSSLLEMEFVDWIMDPKMIGIICAWLLIGIALVGRQFHWLKSKVIAGMTIVVLGLLLAALVSNVLVGSSHDSTRTAAGARVSGEKQP